jgi:hypothetical protein
MDILLALPALTLRPDPIRQKARSEHELPMSNVFTIENVDPNLTKDRMEKQLPKFTCCAMEVKVLPPKKQSLPDMEREDPKRAKLLRLKLLPNAAESRTEIADDNLFTCRIERLLPICAKFNTENASATPPEERLQLLPSLAKARRDNELPT